jgi:hypothetical protein
MMWSTSKGPGPPHFLHALTPRKALRRKRSQLDGMFERVFELMSTSEAAFPQVSATYKG